MFSSALPNRRWRGGLRVGPAGDTGQPVVQKTVNQRLVEAGLPRPAPSGGETLALSQPTEQVAAKATQEGLPPPQVKTATTDALLRRFMLGCEARRKQSRLAAAAGMTETGSLQRPGQLEADRGLPRKARTKRWRTLQGLKRRKQATRRTRTRDDLPQSAAETGERRADDAALDSGALEALKRGFYSDRRRHGSRVGARRP